MNYVSEAPESKVSETHLELALSKNEDSVPDLKDNKTKRPEHQYPPLEFLVLGQVLCNCCLWQHDQQRMFSLSTNLKTSRGTLVHTRAVLGVGRLPLFITPSVGGSEL